MRRKEPGAGLASRSPSHSVADATTEAYAEDAEMVKDNPARYLSGLL